MTAPGRVGQAYIDITPRFRNLTRQVNRAFEQAFRAASRQVGSGGAQVSAGFTRDLNRALRQTSSRSQQEGQTAGVRFISGFTSRFTGGPFRASMGVVSSSVSGLAGLARTGALALTGLGVAGAAAGVSLGVKTAASLEQADVAFTTLLHSASQAKSFLGDLSKFAAATPFELPGLIDASRQLLGAGEAAKNVIPTLRAWGDTAGALGLTQDNFNHAMLAVTQAMGNQKLQAGDLLQITQAGIPIWSLLARALGKPVTEVRKLSEQGKLLTADVLPKLEKQMEKDYGGSMAKQSQTLAGLWSTFMDTLNIGLAKSIQPLIPALKIGLTGAISVVSKVLSGLPAVAGPAIAGIKAGWDTVAPVLRSTVLPGLRTFRDDAAATLGGIADRVREAWDGVAPYLKTTVFPAIAVRVTGFVGDLKQRATGLGTGIWTGLQDGVQRGDWSKLGDTVGAALADVLHRALATAIDIAGWIGEIIAKVDWVGLGISIGKQVPSLLIGLGAGILNFDLGSLLHGLAAHWRDILLGILALAFTPARIVGKIAEILSKIPFAGRLLAWALEHMAAFSRGLVGMVGRALGFMGRAFLDGFARVFPGVGREFVSWLRLFPTRIGLARLWVQDAIGKLLRGLGDKIAEGAGWVISKIGELIGRMLRPFANAGSWLLDAGRNLIRGLGRGITGAWGDTVTWLRGVGSRVKTFFADALNWLYQGGKEIVLGLLRGLKQGFEDVMKFVSGIGPWIASHKGPESYDRNLLVPAGRAIMSGFLRGLKSSGTATLNYLRSVGADISTLFAGITSGTSVSRGLIEQMVARTAASLYGWSGAQWSALRALIMGESGFNPNAQNSTSSAYGIFQFLNTTWAGVGARKTPNPFDQIIAGLRYIAQVYGSPMAAYSAWLSRSPHWYDWGGLITEPILGVGASGQAYGFGGRGVETVIPGRPGGPTLVVNVDARGATDPAGIQAAAQALGTDLMNRLTRMLATATGTN